MIFSFSDSLLYLTVFTLAAQGVLLYDVALMTLRRFGLTRKLGYFDQLWRMILPKTWWRDDFGEYRHWK